MRIVMVDEKSKWLERVISLGDSFRGTIGFFPRQAFDDYAMRNRILAAVDGDDLMGYMLFRSKGSEIIIVQLCVAISHRYQGVAKFLVSQLCLMNKEYYSALRLACRRDYGLDNFWRSLGFMPITERSGRSTKHSTVLTVWLKSNPDMVDLFSLAPKHDEALKKAVLDTNVIIDLCNDDFQSDASLLLQPFMLDNVEYYITPDTLVELNTNKDQVIRNRNRDYARSHFEIIDAKNDGIYDAVCKDLLEFKKVPNISNTGFDISHIAYSIAFGAQVFITRDSEWLNSKVSDYIFEKYGLLIQSPGELIKSVDEICSPTAYSPLSLVGLKLKYSEMQANYFSQVVNAMYLYYGTKKKSAFEQTLRTWMAAPSKYHIILVESTDAPIALIVYTKTDKAEHILCFLLNQSLIKKSLQSTLIKRLVFQNIEDAKNAGLSLIEVEKINLSETFVSALKESSFFDKGNNYVRIICPDIIMPDALEDVASKVGIKPLDRIIERYRASALSLDLKIRTIIQIEKALWPLKIKDKDIPCYIVPIRGNYAKELFDEDLSNTNISLFSNEQIEPALSIENVYYKNSKKHIAIFPARILWYVSYDKSLFGTGMIRACSYLDGVEIGEAKSLYKKYRRLGVLSWDSIKKIGGPDDAYVYTSSVIQSSLQIQ